MSDARFGFILAIQDVALQKNTSPARSGSNHVIQTKYLCSVQVLEHCAMLIGHTHFANSDKRDAQCWARWRLACPCAHKRASLLRLHGLELSAEVQRQSRALNCVLSGATDGDNLIRSAIEKRWFAAKRDDKNDCLKYLVSARRKASR